MLKHTWKISERPDPVKTAAIAEKVGLRPLVVELLLQRGFEDAEEIAGFLHPRLQDLSDPFLMPDMREAVDRIFKAIDNKETVALYGDYDVDGVTSITLLYSFLREFGLETHTFLPHRIDEGYGLNDQGVKRCIEEFKPSLIIAVDCGTSSIAQVDYLNEQGIDVLIFDHHESNSGDKPNAIGVVNPKLGDEHHYFCSAGVIFKLGHAMLKDRRIPNLDLREWLDIVAMGTVADLVPLVGENRILVRKGLQQMAKSRHPGVIALKNVAGMNGNPMASDIGFKLGPRLNASGRLNSAQASLDLLMARDDNKARDLALFLDNQNKERQELEGRIKDEAMEMTADFDPTKQFGIVLGHETWHAGVVGIVASRVTKQFHRPTFVIAFDENGVGKGSGRSVEGISLVDALNSCRDLLIAGGGHDMAAGLSIERKNLDEFRERFNTFIAENVDPSSLEPRLDIDIVAKLEELNLDLLDSYELVHPMGMGNPAPLMMTANVDLAGEPRVLKEKHLKLTVSQGRSQLDAMFFNVDEADLPPRPWDIAYRISRNIFRGRSSLSMVLEAIRTAA